ncbi:unnamed protein product, partial [Laminaria digitata]
ILARISSTLNQDIKVISLVCFPHMMSHVYWLVIPPMFPILMSVYSLNYTEAGAIISVFAAVTTIVQTPVGFLVDKIGARMVLICGLALEAVAIGMFGVATA